MPDVAWSTRNQSHSGWRSSATNAAFTPHRKRGGRKTVAASRLLRVLVVHLLEERRGLNAPLLLELDQLAGAVPFLQLLGHELAPGAVALLEFDGKSPWLLQDGRQRHFETGPFRIGETFGERRVVVHPADAVALLQRDFGLGLALEGDDVGAVFL